MRMMHDFLFRRTSATGFGLMRIAWALTVLAYYIPRLPSVTRFYSGGGLLPTGSEALWQSDFRYTLLSVITEPRAVLLLYILFLLATVYAALGLYPRTVTPLAVLLLFSFHERNALMLGGGDTVLRTVGFLLVLTPGTRALSLSRAAEQWQNWKQHRTLLPPLQMSIWPRRLLLWQLIVIYLTSLWSKLMGTMWVGGSAVGITLHHPHFARFSTRATWIFQILSPLFSTLTLLFESAWLLLLIPERVFSRAFSFTKGQYKRWLLLTGILFHGMIFILYDVGSFSIAMFTAYCGLLDEEDFEAMRNFCNRLWLRRNEQTNKRINVFFDGHCGLCQRSMFTFKLFDWLHRLEPVDFQNPILRKKFAPDISYAELDRSMHIRFSGSRKAEVRSARESPNSMLELRTSHFTLRTLTGFDAFRALTWRLPPLWPVAPFLSLPGIAHLGRKIYTRVAAKRKKCTHEECGL